MLAAIDAGSNTLRLLIGKVADGKVVPELYLRRICRLAGGFSEETGLSPAARERTLFVFNEFAESCRQFDVQQVRARRSLMKSGKRPDYLLKLSAESLRLKRWRSEFSVRLNRCRRKP